MSATSEFLSKLSLGTYRLPKNGAGLETLLLAAEAGINKVSTARSYYNDAFVGIYAKTFRHRSDFEVSYKLALSDLDSARIAFSSTEAGLRRCGVDKFDEITIEVLHPDEIHRKLQIVDELSGTGLANRIGITLPNPGEYEAVKSQAVKFVIVPATAMHAHFPFDGAARIQVFAPFNGGSILKNSEAGDRALHIKQAMSALVDVEKVHFGVSSPQQLTETISALT